MNLDDLVKYLMWVVFLGLCLVAIYFLFKKLGIIG